jgi:hypothetical protein
MKALLLVGSPRGKNSTSYSIGTFLIDLLQIKGFKTNTFIIKRELIAEGNISNMLEEINNSDVIILTAPLYDDSEPYIVIKTMELIYAKKMKLDSIRFIPIINCGFFESKHITAVAIPIYHQFAKKVGLKWVGSLAIGGGEIFQGSKGKLLDDLGKQADKIKILLEEIAMKLVMDINVGDLVPKVFPKIFYNKSLKKIFIRLNNRNWKKVAKRNGGVVDAKPYLD